MKETIIKLNREQLLGICDRYDKFESVRAEVNGKLVHLTRLEANEKARKYCYESIPPWGLRVNENVNAIIRAAHLAGPMDSYQLSTLMATAEHYTIAELAKDALTEPEYTLLATPIAEVLPAAAQNPAPTRHVAPMGRQTAQSAGSRKRAQAAVTVTTEAREPSVQELAEQFGLAAPPQAAEPAAEDDLAEFAALLDDAPGPEAVSVEEIVQRAREEQVATAPADEDEDEFLALLESA